LLNNIGLKEYLHTKHTNYGDLSNDMWFINTTKDHWSVLSKQGETASLTPHASKNLIRFALITEVVIGSLGGGMRAFAPFVSYWLCH